MTPPAIDIVVADMARSLSCNRMNLFAAVTAEGQE
jgi:hypothetical protein